MFKVIFLMVFAGLISWKSFADPPVVDSAKELVILDSSVRNDERTGNFGAWSFGSLMKSIAPPSADLAIFTQNWLDEWASEKPINGFTETGDLRGVTDLQKMWSKTGAQKLDLANTPFQLLAIVYRPDETDFAAAGQMRMIYGANPDPYNGFSRRTFDVGFEFKLPGSPQSWASKWHSLGKLSFGAEFNSALQAITDEILKAGASNLLQVRTSDFMEYDDPWDFRQFTLDSAGNLRASQTPQSPAIVFYGSRQQEISQWIAQNADAINAGTLKLDPKFEGGFSRMLEAGPGLASDLEESPSPAIKAAREKIDSQTCNRCHSDAIGQQISNPAHGGPAMSRFLIDQIQTVRIPLLQKLLMTRGL